MSTAPTPTPQQIIGQTTDLLSHIGNLGQEEENHMRKTKTWEMVSKQMHDREEECTPIVLVVVMMHMIIREACQHILKTAPVPQNILLTDPLYAEFALETCAWV